MHSCTMYRPFLFYTRKKKMSEAAQKEIFQEFEGQDSSHSFFNKQRNRWSRNQMRVIEIMSDPLSAFLTNRQIAQHCHLSERYIYKLLKDERFIDEVDKRRKEDKTVKLLIAKVWKALFHNIEDSPQKISIAMKALGELREGPLVSINQYRDMPPEEVDRRLQLAYNDRKRLYVTDGEQ